MLEVRNFLTYALWKRITILTPDEISFVFVGEKMDVGGVVIGVVASYSSRPVLTTPSVFSVTDI